MKLAYFHQVPDFPDIKQMSLSGFPFFPPCFLLFPQRPAVCSARRGQKGCVVGTLPSRPRVCSRGFFERVPVSVQLFLALLASRYGARRSTLARDQTRTAWQEGSVALISPRGIHLSVNGRLWGRLGKSKCLASLQGQMFFSAVCPDRKGRPGGLLQHV